MKVVDQNIPAELYGPYVNTLGQAAVWHPGSDVRTLKRREWYELIHSKSPPKGAPSAAQLAVRAAFKRCVDCFNASPKTGGVEPPAIGYRSKEWWYAASGELTWPDYIGEKKISWDGDAADPYQLKDSNYDYHDANWFLKTDEQDFIDFYDEMKPKYGYPWSAKNSSDQIVAKMNQIVCNEIEYDAEGDLTVAFTPGQTAQARKGVCDDQSILHYALTYKALKEIGWTNEQVDERLGVLINERGDKGHVYNWWKSINGTTRIVENTYDPGDAPKVVGGMKYWGADLPYYLIQLFNKTGHTFPWFIGNGRLYSLWYYNYFIHKSWGYFYAGVTPDWCKEYVPPPVEWTEVAPQLSAETWIWSLVVFNDKIYGGTAMNGKLYEWNGVDAWIEKAPKLNNQAGIKSMVVFHDKIYGGTKYGGRLFEWNGSDAWVQVAPKLDNEEGIQSLAVFNDKIYGGTYPRGNLYEWNGANSWIQRAPQINDMDFIHALVVFNGKLYGAGDMGGRLLEWNGTDAWVHVADWLSPAQHCHSLAVFGGKIYGGMYPDGLLYEWNSAMNTWVQVAPQLGSENRIHALKVFNYKLYGGTGSHGLLYEWNGTDAWVQRAPQLDGEQCIFALAVLDDKLYGGTGYHGRLYKAN